jgi:hypothetical protein
MSNIGRFDNLSNNFLESFNKFASDKKIDNTNLHNDCNFKTNYKIYV